MVCSVSAMASAIMSGIRRAAPVCAASTPRSAASTSCKDIRRLANALSEKVRSAPCASFRQCHLEVLCKRRMYGLQSPHRLAQWRRRYNQCWVPKPPTERRHSVEVSSNTR